MINGSNLKRGPSTDFPNLSFWEPHNCFHYLP